jgi:hypothetical protein
MERQPVTSSNVRSIGYAEDAQTLEVEFNNGGIYEYLGVPPSEYEALMQAPSVGSYLHAHIKDKYPYRKTF